MYCFWNLPFLLYRIYKYRLFKKGKKLKTKQGSNACLEDLCTEILFKILKICGIVELYRLGACSRVLHSMTLDKVLWEKKLLGLSFKDSETKTRFKLQAIVQD